MPLEPVDWSVVIAARWNRAILTPAGIRQRIFQIEEEVPLEVSIPIDLLAPPKVMLDKMSVVADRNKLVIRPTQFTFEEINRAQGLALNAVDALPETPFEAVGINIAYKADEDENAIAPIVDSDVDVQISDNDFNILGRELIRQLDWRGGRINICVSDTDTFRGVKLNIERIASDTGAIRRWLEIPVDELRDFVNKVVVDCLSF